MTFVRGQPVLWKGDPCIVLGASNQSVALERDRDGFTVITSESALERHQKVASSLPPAPKLGAS